MLKLNHLPGTFHLLLLVLSSESLQNLVFMISFSYDPLSNILKIKFIGVILANEII